MLPACKAGKRLWDADVSRCRIGTCVFSRLFWRSMCPMLLGRLAISMHMNGALCSACFGAGGA
jgi:hypothetical protein